MLDEKALARGGYGGILAVGARLVPAAATGPAELRPARRQAATSRWSARASPSTPAVSNLKPGDGMYTMKCDMAGAAAVFAAVHAIAESRPAR